MTPEERFTKIVNAIEALTETQARQEAQLDKQNAGIRDLIVVSRTLLDAQPATDTRLSSFIGATNTFVDATEDRFSATDTTLKDLIKTVNELSAAIDRFLNHAQLS